MINYIFENLNINLIYQYFILNNKSMINIIKFTNQYIEWNQ